MKSLIKTIFQVWVACSILLFIANIIFGSNATEDKTEETVTQIYNIPSDPNGKYEFLRIKQMDNGNVLVVTKRYGKITEIDNDGISFTAREINCKNSTFRYIGEGDTIEEMTANRIHASSTMAPLTEKSISSYIAGYSCEKFVKYRKDV
jgi:hypothetical protein